MHLHVLHELWAIYFIEENKKERGATLVIFYNLGRYISIFLYLERNYSEVNQIIKNDFLF